MGGLAMSETKATDDSFEVSRSGLIEGNLINADNGSGTDSGDPDSDALQIAYLTIDGTRYLPDTAITLASGAELTVGADGAILYDPGDAFDDLARGTAVTETFSYTLQRGPTLFDLADPEANLAHITDVMHSTVDSSGSAGTDIGYAVAGAGDFDGDGIDDFLITVPNADSGNGALSGAVYLVYGEEEQRLDTLDLDDLTKSTGIRIFGYERYDRIGFSVAGVGDINNDGYDDILIGAPKAVYTKSQEGQVYAFFGREGRSSSVLEISDLDGGNGFIFSGGRTRAETGISVAAGGDINNDGIPDALIGVPGYDYSGIGGMVDIIHGIEDGISYPRRPSGDDEGQEIFGRASVWYYQSSDNYGFTSETYAEFGWSVASAGDFNGDGLDDLIIGAPLSRSQNGTAFLVLNDADGLPAPIELHGYSSLQNYFPEEIIGASNAMLGASVSGIGDINHDGLDDIALFSAATGMVTVIFGTTDSVETESDLWVTGDGTGTVVVDAMTGDNGFTFATETTFSPSAGKPVALLAPAGDFNGDGIDDFLIGDPYADFNGVSDSGAAYILFGSTGSFSATYSADDLDGENGVVVGGHFGSGAKTGFSVAGVGDVDNDGFDDVLIGSPDASIDGTSAGRASLVYGQSFDSHFDTGAVEITVYARSRIAIEGVEFTESGDDLPGYATLAVTLDGVVEGGVTVDYQTVSETAQAGQDFIAQSGTLTFAGTDGEQQTIEVEIPSDNVAEDTLSFDVTLTGSDGGDYVYIRTPTATVTLLDDDAVPAFNGDLALSITENTNAVTLDPFSDADGDILSYALSGADADLLRIDRKTGELRFHLSPDYEVPEDADLDGVYVVTVHATDGVNEASADLTIEVLDDASEAEIARPVSASLVVGDDAFLMGVEGPRLVNLFADHGDGPDLGTAGAELSISAVDGVASRVGEMFTLDSGATVKVRQDGWAILDASGVADNVHVLGSVQDSFTYTVWDAQSEMDEAARTATVSLTFLTDRVTAHDDATTTTSLASVAGNLLTAGYGDADVAPVPANLQVIAVDGAASAVGGTFSTDQGGTVGVNSDGTFVYNPNGAFDALAAGETAEDQFTYTASNAFPDTLELADLNASTGTRINGIAKGDRAGVAVNGIGDVNGDGIDDLAIGASYADPSGAQSGATYIVYGSIAGIPSDFDLALLDGANGFVIEGLLADAYTGTSIAGVGDLNQDGIDDFAIGAPKASPLGATEGAAYVVFGSNDGFGAVLDLTDLDGTNGFVVAGAAADDRAGQAVRGAGDINGDGIEDLLVGAHLSDAGGKTNAGAVHVIFGSAGGFDSLLELDTLDGSNGFRIDGLSAGDQLAREVAALGDFNGDGRDDLVVGARLADPSGSASGEAYIVYGFSDPSVADLDLGTLDVTTGLRFQGAAADDRTGHSVASAGDVNGDGLADVVIGGWKSDVGATNAGEAYILFGNDAEQVATLAPDDLDGSNGFRLQGTDAEGWLGLSVAGAGDINRDGFDDVLVGSYGVEGQTGGAWVVYGSGENFNPTLSVADITADTGLELIGDQPIDQTGFSVAAAGDVNGDGTDDILVGARRADPNNVANAGATYVVYGRSVGRDTATVTVSVTGVNDAPILALPTTLELDENETELTDFTATDPEGDTVTVTISGQDADLLAISTDATATGSMSAAPQTGPGPAAQPVGHKLSFRKAPNFEAPADSDGDGFYNLTITASDGAHSVSRDVQIKVRDANDRPDALDDRYTVGADGTVTGNLLMENGIDSDEDGDSLFVVAVQGDQTAIGTPKVLPSGALLVVHTDGRFVYTPNGAFTPNADDPTPRDQITYTVADGMGGTAIAKLLVAITVDGIERGSDGRDKFGGGVEDNRMLGMDGNDRIDGGAGNDHLNGGNGDDRLFGRHGDDTLVGELGADRLFGGLGADVLDGGEGDDRLIGSRGSDTLTGGNGHDVLMGGGQDDVLYGGDGDDRIAGGRGDDTLTGGDGDDFFIFENVRSGLDTITDFNAQEDIIQLSEAGLQNLSVSLQEGNTKIAHGTGNEILLLGVELTEADILFI